MAIILVWLKYLRSFSEIDVRMLTWQFDEGNVLH